MHLVKRACALMLFSLPVIVGVHGAGEANRNTSFVVEPAPRAAHFETEASSTAVEPATTNAYSATESANLHEGLAAAALQFKRKPKPTATPEEIAEADRLFQSGRFDAAEKAYAEIEAIDSKNLHAVLQLGYIALLANKLDGADIWLHKALDLNHGNADAKIMLAEMYYRKSDFFHAGRELQGLGPDAAAKMANYTGLNQAKLESFRDDDPNKLDHGAGESTRITFVKSDPLPVVKIRVNGEPEITVFIDTGSSELILDSDYGHELKLKSFGSVQGTFSGGQHASVEQSRIDSLTLGSFTLRNVPVAMMSLRPLSKMFGVAELDGCIGTNVLYQFLATIDYRANELILRRKNSQNLKRFLAAVDGKASAIPFWMAGDHFMVAWGQVNQTPPALFFVDSGLAGAGVKLAESSIKEAGIRLDESKATQGEGGGGSLKTIPYTVAQFAVGLAPGQAAQPADPPAAPAQQSTKGGNSASGHGSSHGSGPGSSPGSSPGSAYGSSHTLGSGSSSSQAEGYPSDTVKGSSDGGRMVVALKEQNVPGLYDGPFPWESAFGFRLAGMFGSDFLKGHAVTFDFVNMRIIFM
jgi:tetratricopeptide (TPR) repeat protein